MKYYAVTDDINELYHYGVKGMKWGQHLFGQERSPGYHRAATKLKNLIKSARNDVETRSDRRYKKQIEKALKRSEISRQKYGWDQISNGIRDNERAFAAARREVAKSQRIQNKVAKIQNRMNINQQKYEARLMKSQLKQSKLAAKAEKRFDKYLQEAREGRLRAGKLSDEQVDRINQRLSEERMARQLGGSEKASYRSRKKEAIREGKLEGYKRGTAAGMEALAKGLVDMSLKSRFVKAANNRSEARRQRKKNQIINKKTHRQMRRELREEAYDAKIHDESWRPGVLGMFSPTKHAAKRLGEINSAKEQKKLNDELQISQYKDWLKRGKNEAADVYRKRIGEEASTGAMRDELKSREYYTIKKPESLGTRTAERIASTRPVKALKKGAEEAWDATKITGHKISEKTKKRISEGYKGLAEAAKEGYEEGSKAGIDSYNKRKAVKITKSNFKDSSKPIKYDYDDLYKQLWGTKSKKHK